MMVKKFTILLAVIILALMATFPTLAQEGQPTLEIQVDENGTSVYLVGADGTRYLITFVPIGNTGILIPNIVIPEPVEEVTVEVADIIEIEVVDADITDRGYLLVNTSYLNVRSSDGLGYTILGVVSGGDMLPVVGRNEDRSWWYVDVGGVRGWVSGAMVFVRGDLTDVPVMETVGTLIQPTLYVGYAGNVIYDELSAAGVAVCTLPGNAEHFLVGRSAGGNWYQILTTCNGEAVIGWIQANRGIVINPAGLPIPITYR